MWRIPPPNSSPLSKCPPFFFCMKLVTFASMVNGLSLEIIYSTVYDKQEAQLSQRDRAYIEHFAKSHKFTQGHSKRHCWVGHVYVPISIQLKLSLYIVPFLRYWASKMAWLWNRGRVRWRSLEMAPFDRSYTTLDRYCKYSSNAYRFWVICRWII